MNTGHTYDLTTDEQRRNEHAAVLEMCALNPHNEYWANRLIALQTVSEVESDMKWLSDIQSMEADFADLRATERDALV